MVNMGNKIRFKPVKLGDVAAPSLDKIDDLITVDVYEGYRKLGRYRLTDARIKFR